jgi:hypothetical protein
MVNLYHGRVLGGTCDWVLIPLVSAPSRNSPGSCHEILPRLFVTPVPVTVTGSFLWDGEHRSPNTVGPEGLQPTKAWEIHPIKQLAER